MANRPTLLRRAFDTVEQRLEELVRGSTFAATMTRVQRTQAALKHVIDTRTRAVWHLINLPAGSDVRILRRQIANLDREIRLLRAEVDRARRHAGSADQLPLAAEPRKLTDPRTTATSRTKKASDSADTET